jgi:outer membrane lipoprotein-sorting protein
MTMRLWDRAAALPAVPGERDAEVAALGREEPTVAELFTFMRDAELRFETLRMRIDEHTYGGRGEQAVRMDVTLQHPSHARVVTSEPSGKGVAPSEIWLSDGETVWTYATAHKLATKRPVRPRLRGLEATDLPSWSKVYDRLTPLPMETLADLFVHPAGYCQNVLATGECWVSGTDVVEGREAVLLECDHPRAVERFVDRPDYHIQVAVDRETGVILRLAESVGGELTRLATVTMLHPDARLQPGAFDLDLPEGTTVLY